VESQEKKKGIVSIKLELIFWLLSLILLPVLSLFWFSPIKNALLINYFVLFGLSAVYLLWVVFVADQIINHLKKPLKDFIQQNQSLVNGSTQSIIVNNDDDDIKQLALLINQLKNSCDDFEQQLLSASKSSELILSRLEEQKYALDQHSIVAITDIKGTISYANDKFCLISGYSREELVGQNHRLLKSGSHNQDFYQQMYLTISKGFVWQGNICNKDKNGRLYWVATTIVPFMENNIPQSYVAIGTDITKEIEKEQELRLSEERYNLAMSVANDGIWDWDLQNNTVHYDERFYTMAGYQYVDFPQDYLEWIERIHPDDLVDVENYVKQFFIKNTKEKYEIEFRFRKKDKSYIWVLSRGKIVSFDHNKNPTRMVGTHCDITKRKQYEQKFTKLNRYLDSILYNMPIGVAILEGKSLNYFRVNQYLADLNGLSAEEHIGKSLSEVIPNASEILAPLLTKVMQTGEPILNREFSIDLPNNYRSTYLTDWHIPLRNEKGIVNSILSVVIDVTELKETQNQLRHVQKMEAIGQLTGGIAHDFNNILGIIIGNLDLLGVQFGSNSKAFNRIESASKAADRAASLTKQLLSFSRNKITDNKIININQLLTDMKDMLRHSLGQGITLEVKLHEEIWLTEIDPGDTQDAILNLLINARDAIADKGKVIIETKNVVLNQRFCQLNIGASPGEYVLITVIDNGEGMDKEIQKRIFEPFFTTKAQGKGTGLGLAMVFGFVKRTAGYISVSSDCERGTKFNIYLPKNISTLADKHNMENMISLAEIEKTGNEQLLIVDDEKDLVELAKHFLMEKGYKVFTAYNSIEALEILSCESDIRLIFSDIVMPIGLSGFDLATKVENEYPEVKILLTSGFSEKHSLNNNYDIAQYTLLNKPYSQSELVSNIRNVLDAPVL